jgi:glycosyltransferase involved in cell wall biosynthesis
LRERYHADLSDARVTNFTTAAVCRELTKVAWTPQSQWDALIRQNRWFQAEAVRHLRTNRIFEGKGVGLGVLAYSYAAREILDFARDAGARTILAQIDGGEADEARIDSLWSRRSKIMPDKAPSIYWQTWREECRIADHIFVNSEWSQNLVVQAGVDSRKLAVVPIVYERSSPSEISAHQYPMAFDTRRPFMVLFLGTMTLRKGVIETIEAARVLAGHPVHFIFVGADPEGYGALMKREPNITWHGRVPRSRVLQFYRDADVLLFPTHSDGFGMTQIEALESGLPVIASRNCAAIIEHGKTGLLLEEVSSDDIVRAIRQCLDFPQKLAAMSTAAVAAGAAFAHRSAAAFLNAIQAIANLECR